MSAVSPVTILYFQGDRCTTGTFTSISGLRGAALVPHLCFSLIRHAMPLQRPHCKVLNMVGKSSSGTTQLLPIFIKNYLYARSGVTAMVVDQAPPRGIAPGAASDPKARTPCPEPPHTPQSVFKNMLDAPDDAPSAGSWPHGSGQRAWGAHMRHLGLSGGRGHATRRSAPHGLASGGAGSP
jgi:hypothetical protein